MAANTAMLWTAVDIGLALQKTLTKVNYGKCFLIYILSDSDSMFDAEIMFVGGKIYYSFNKPYQGGNTGPAEQQVQYAHSDLTHVKLVDAKSPKKNSQKSGGYFTLDRPGGTDAFINHLLVVVSLLCLCRLVWMYRRMILLLRVGLLEIGLLIVRLLPARRRLDVWLCS